MVLSKQVRKSDSQGKLLASSQQKYVERSPTLAISNQSVLPATAHIPRNLTSKHVAHLQRFIGNQALVTAAKLTDAQPSAHTNHIQQRKDQQSTVQKEFQEDTFLTQSEGKASLTYPLTHTMQQNGTIQRFEANEHKMMGDLGSSNRKGKAQTITLGKAPDQMEVTFGDITAMAGDYFGSVTDVYEVANKPGDGKNKKGTQDEIRYIVAVKIRKTKKDSDFGEDVVKAVTGRYYTLAGKNVTHFTNPNRGDAGRTHKEKANERDMEGNLINNAGSYRANHLSAIEEAWKAGKAGRDLNSALLFEGFASHFLTDAYASGHMRTERQGIKDWWDGRVPMFWHNLQLWMAENIAEHLNEHSVAGAATVQFLWEQAQDTLRTVLKTKSIPALTFGDAISGAVHDMDNERGVTAKVGDKIVTLVGDGQVLDESDRALAVGVETSKKAAAGVKVSLKDIHKAFAAGKAGEIKFDKVQKSLQLKNGLFRAEQLWPRALTDSDSRQTNKSLNWRVDSVEQLFQDERMKQALAHFAHEKADTLGAEIDLDPPLKADKTLAMKESVLDKLKANPDSVIKTFRQIINYTPNSVSGDLGGVGGHDTDDNAVDYWKATKEKNALPMLTLEQRKRLLKDVLEGPTIGEENEMILDLLTTNNGQLRATINSVGWRRVWDELTGEDCRKFIRHCGPLFWKEESFNSKRLEVKFLADGPTNDIAQETIMIILRTCSADEVRAIDDQVGGISGLSFDLDGRWDTEFKKMKAGK